MSPKAANLQTNENPPEIIAEAFQAVIDNVQTSVSNLLLSLPVILSTLPTISINLTALEKPPVFNRLENIQKKFLRQEPRSDILSGFLRSRPRDAFFPRERLFQQAQNFPRQERSDVPTRPTQETIVSAIRSTNPDEDSLYDRVTSEIEVPYEYQCAITHTIMRDPVYADDNQIYERFAIEEWMRQSNDTISPWTRVRISNHFIPATELKNDILRFLQTLPTTICYPTLTL